MQNPHPIHTEAIPISYAIQTKSKPNPYRVHTKPIPNPYKILFVCMGIGTKESLLRIRYIGKKVVQGSGSDGSLQKASCVGQGDCK